LNRWITWTAGGAVATVVVFGLAAYVERGRIAEGAARRWLAEHGAAASALDIKGLSLTGFSARIRLGPPADPDLTVDRMDVRYALAGPWTGGGLALHPASITLVHPRLNVRYGKGVLSFGALDRVIQALARLPRSTEPLPDIVVVNGEARLLTVGGDVRLRAAGSLRAGALTMLQGQVEPLHLRFGNRSVESGGGAFGLKSFAGSLRLSLDQRLIAVADPAGSLRIARLLVSAETPYPDGQSTWSGPASAGVEATDAAGRLGAVTFDRASLGATFAGTMQATPARQGFRGAARVRVQAGSVAAGGATSRLAAMQVALSDIALDRSAGDVKGGAAATADLTLARVTAPGLTLKSVSSQIRSDHVLLQVGKSAPVVSAVVDGNLLGAGAASGPAGDGPYLAAVRDALAGFHVSASRWRAELSASGASAALLAPLTIGTASGARVILSAEARSRFPTSSVRGFAKARIQGGGLPTLDIAATNAVLSRRGSSADIVVQGAADTAPAKGLAFRVAGAGTWRGSEGRFSLASCAPLSIDRLTISPDTLTKVSANLCPTAMPLLVTSPSGWRLNGRVDSLRADDAGQLVSVRGVTSSIAAAGSTTGLRTAALTLEAGEVVDAATPRRFEPMTGVGQMELTDGLAAGRLNIGLAKGPPLAALTFRHALTTGAGRADIDAGVAFTRSGLQPAGLSPLASAVRNANGTATFVGWLSWAPRADLKSGGEFATHTLDFTSPVGAVAGLDTDIRFTSLAPLATAPNQKVTIREVQAFLPVTALAAQFDLGPSRLNLTGASGTVAGGHLSLEPMTLMLTRAAETQGVIVLDNIDLGQILAATSLSDAVKTDAVVNGRIPFQVGPKGLTIARGELASVKAGRISISRGALTGASAGAAAAPPGFAEDLAYQAMDNLAFDTLEASRNSRDNDRLAMLFHIKGRHDPPTRKKATVAVKDILSGHALDKPLTLPSDTKIDLTLDTSLNFGDLVKALLEAWREALAPLATAGHSRAVHDPTAKHPSP
jgi:hypothetical protein